MEAKKTLEMVWAKPTKLEVSSLSLLRTVASTNLIDLAPFLLPQYLEPYDVVSLQPFFVFAIASAAIAHCGTHFCWLHFD